MQHAIGSRPDPAHGYCTDDVARALQVDLLHRRSWVGRRSPTARGASLRLPRRTPSIPRPGDSATSAPWTGRGSTASASEDSQGRAMLALGEAIAGSPDARMVESATALFERALPGSQGRPRPPRSGIRAARMRRDGDRGAETRWPPSGSARWPSSSVPASPGRSTPRGHGLSRSLTYENALPARALIVAGRALGSDEQIDAGLRVLDWLHRCPDRDRRPPVPDRERVVAARRGDVPLRPTADRGDGAAPGGRGGVSRDRRTIATGPPSNGPTPGSSAATTSALDVADPARGAGYDGLTAEGVNTNQGAESTLMWLIAAEHIRAIRAGRSDRRRTDRDACSRRSIA